MIHAHGSHLKLGWAQHHLDTLKASIEEFIKLKPYTFRIDPHPQPPHYVIRGYINRPVPHSFGLTIGDFAHNARSALDHVVFTLSGLPLSDIENRKKLQFPICDNPADYQSHQGRRLNGVVQQWQDLIKSLQPCERAKGSECLSILRDVNNTDKHQVLAPVGSIGRQPMLTISMDTKLPAKLVMGGGAHFRSGNLDVVMSGTGAVTEDGTIVARITYTGEGNLNIDPGMAIEIEFGEGNIMVKGKPILGTLALVLDHVKEVVGKFNL